MWDTGNFYDDVDGGTFGTVKKNARRPLSNFAFKFVTKIIASDSRSTGYLVEVNPESLQGNESDDSMSCDDEQTSRYISWHKINNNIIIMVN